MKRVIALIILVVCLILTVCSFAEISVSKPVSFKSRMMKSVASQINSAADLTVSEDNRAVLAALLTLEYQYQKKNEKIDFSLPIYVTKSDTLASVVFAVSNKYVMVMFEKSPLSTYYCSVNSKDSRLGLNWYSSAKNRAALTVMLAAEITDANWTDGNHIYSMISFYESYIGKKSSDEYVIIGGSSTGMFEIHYLPNNHTATYKIIQTETSRSALEKSMKSICSKYYINTLKDISEGFDLVQSFIAK